MLELNTITESESFIIKSSGLELTCEQYQKASSSEWVSQQLDHTAKAALDPDYPALAQVMEYRAALRAYRDSNYESDRPQLEI